MQPEISFGIQYSSRKKESNGRKHNHLQDSIPPKHCLGVRLGSGSRKETCFRSEIAHVYGDREKRVVGEDSARGQFIRILRLGSGMEENINYIGQNLYPLVRLEDIKCVIDYIRSSGLTGLVVDVPLLLSAGILT